jgi:hypothetical protein
MCMCIMITLLARTSRSSSRKDGNTVELAQNQVVAAAATARYNRSLLNVRRLKLTSKKWTKKHTSLLRYYGVSFQRPSFTSGVYDWSTLTKGDQYLHMNGVGQVAKWSKLLQGTYSRHPMSNTFSTGSMKSTAGVWQYMGHHAKRCTVLYLEEGKVCPYITDGERGI